MANIASVRAALGARPATDGRPSLRCRMGLHHFEPAGTDPTSPWIVLADECACGAQRPLPI